MSSGYCVKRSKKAVKKLLFTRYYPAKRVTENGVNSNRNIVQPLQIRPLSLLISLIKRVYFKALNTRSIKL